MGNQASEVNDSLKAQAGGEGGPEVYKWVGMSSEGELVRLMKIAVQTKDYTPVDDFIRNVVVQSLYNNGEGEHVN
jgi:hypothetical protein